MAVSARERFLKEYPAALSNDAGAIFIGAGASMAAGYPSWTKLLQNIGEELGINSADIHDLAALAQWSITSSGSATQIRQVIRDNIGVNYPIPEALQTIARLPIKHLWTTNYDRLIERSFEEINRPLDTIPGAKDLALRARPGASRLYKMHGSIERLDDLVISTDDYELFRSTRGAYLPLLQAHLMSMSVLFVGLSFTDPNIRHVLSLIRESFTDAPPEHYAIVRPPHRNDFKTEDEFKARSIQHTLWANDLRRYGLIAVEIDDYAEVPELLRQVERRVAKRRIWISGSWPVETGDAEAAKVYAIASKLGQLVGREDLSLVTGAGLLVGSASIAGFLHELRSGGGWDLDRRLIARPFPQPLQGKPADISQWGALRTELARQSGTVIFVGGLKDNGAGKLIVANGVLEEAKLALAEKALLIPIGVTGGAAKELAKELIGSAHASDGDQAIRPTDDELRALDDPFAEVDALIDTVQSILKRTSTV